MTARIASAGEAPCVVLIHGAWLGGWAWEPTVELLRKHGVDAITPTLTGLGDRSHLMGPNVDLRTHVTDIVQTLRFIPATRVMLVGHSYGGVIASEVAAEMPERVAGLVVLDGFLAVAERSIVESYPAMQALLDGIGAVPDAMLVSPPDPGLLTDDVESMAATLKRMRPMPMRAFKQKCLHTAVDLSCERYYARLSRFPFFADTLIHAREAGWDTCEIEADHLAPLTAPALVADQIVSIVRRHRRST